MSTKTLEFSEEELIARWETVVPQHEDLSIGQTISRQSPVETFQRRNTMGSLPRIDGDNEVNEFDIKRTIGQGGMGLVRLARQRSLEREVAIKTILPEQIDGDTVHRLLRESWVTGILEHPNIVPIHALGVDENDAPMLVMKRIEGITWDDALEGKQPMPDAFRGGRDELEDHINILIQLCHAVQFAHSKGIIHCDLKPENVMLGDYGEVYLLDWGVAVTIEEDPSGRLPKAEEVDNVCGTPAFIAPELAEGRGSEIDERTDVYLLGAILHFVVTGKPRHEGATVMATLINAYRSAQVDYDDSVPRELAAICNMATHADRDQRFANVAAFRKALLEFLQHRDSRRLSQESEVRLFRLESRISRRIEGEDPQVELDDEEAAEVYRLFAECRFGFEQALTVWENNREAQAGLKRCLQLMLEFELYQRDAKAAALLLEDLPQAAPEYEERLEKLREELDREAEEIERNKQFIRDIDVSLARRDRSILCVFLGFLFGVAPFFVLLSDHLEWVAFDYQSYMTQFAAVVTGSALIVTIMRKRLLQNAINARLIAAIFIILGGCLIMRIQAYLMGLGPPEAIALENGVLAFAMVMLALAIDRKIWPASLPFLTGAITGSIYPEYILPIDGISNALSVWVLAWVWRDPGGNSPD